MDAVDPEIQRMVALFEAHPSGAPPAPSPLGSSSQNGSETDPSPSSASRELGDPHNPLLDDGIEEDVSNWRAAAANFSPEERAELEDEIAEYYDGIGLELDPDAPLLPALEDEPVSSEMDDEQPEDFGPDQLLIPTGELTHGPEPLGPEFPDLAIEEPHEPEPIEAAPRFAELAPHDPDSGQAEAIVEPPELTDEEELALLAIEQVFAAAGEAAQAHLAEPTITSDDFAKTASTAVAASSVPEPVLDEPETEPEAEPAVVSEESVVSQSAPRDPLRPRRLALLAVLTVLAVFGAFKLVGPPPASPSAAPDAVPGHDTQAAFPAGSAQDRTAAALAAALSWKELNGSFAGFTHPGAFVAASPSQVILTSGGSDGCWNAAVLESGVKEPRPAADPSACSEEGIAQAREALTKSASQARMSETLVASALLSEAAESARFYASRNYVGGSPSFEGLPPLPQEGVESQVLDNGAALRLLSSEGECVSMTIRVEPGADQVSRC